MRSKSLVSDVPEAGQLVAFVFAHQDDEMGVFPLIEQAIAEKRIPVCIYLTSDSKTSIRFSKTREAESCKVLETIGVNASDIHFLGSELGVQDGELMRHLNLSIDRLVQLLKTFDKLKRVYVHAYEGGHHDHDAANVAVAHALESMSASYLGWQFPMYRASKLFFVPYTINKPLPENGVVKKIIFCRLSSIRYVFLTFSYRSQWKSMLGLVPFYMIAWVCGGHSKIQPIDLRRTYHRPHSGSLLYEQHGRTSYQVFKKHVAELSGE